MKIRLVAIDLDGTLLNSANQMTQTTAAILRMAGEAHGMRIVLASARPPRTVLPFYSLLDLDTPMINYNGALVYEPRSQRVLMHRPIPLETARQIVEISREAFPGVTVSVEVLDHWYANRIIDAYRDATGQESEPEVVGPIANWLNMDVTKLLLLGPPEQLKEVTAALVEQVPYQVSMTLMEDNTIQVMHATVSKEQALRVVAAELGVEREEVMAIGDNANDVGMLQWAGVGVAMANSAPQAIEAANFITDHQDADGAAKAVRNIIIKGLEGLPKRK